ncbi:hypothetical protein PENFLA_c017G09758 [Penicillium flavigenum]|uniref:Uncharacterized protein n=1 Tax=Penicillium flavigenum TaxID=254877 RepID=A0A1V6T2N9_9EURO|nr:hypothetical protein PENFLA_c017G09758 [Penicillium flavigenum]
MRATEAAILDYANEIYEALQQKLAAQRQRKELASVDATAQAYTDPVRDNMADELVQRASEKRARNQANISQEESERPATRLRSLPPSPSPSSPSLQTEMALFLNRLNSAATSEAASAAAKKEGGPPV